MGSKMFCGACGAEREDCMCALDARADDISTSSSRPNPGAAFADADSFHDDEERQTAPVGV